MPTLKKIKVSGKEYWILIHSVRQKNKIIQKKKYIGKTLPSKKDLEKIKSLFLTSLRNKETTYFTSNELKLIEQKKETYNKDLKSLSKTERKKKQTEFMIRYTYDSSKLSGVEITLRQTFLILKEGIIPKDFKSLKVVKEIENHEKGFILITKYKSTFNSTFLKKLHKTLLAGIDDEIAGKFRNELKKDVKIAGTIYIPPKWNQLEKEIINFFTWYKNNNKKLHPLELAALTHLKLISIQPFVDGNSRLSRLLMNWILWKKNYPLIDIPIEDLEKYYNVLDYYQIEKKEKPFIDYIKKKFLENS